MKKRLYFIYLMFSIILFLIELTLYLKFNSILFGFLYMIISLVLLFILSFEVINYSELNMKVRLSKNAILIFLLIMLMLLTLFKYNDQSLLFIKNIKILLYIFKPVQIISLIVLSIYDYRVKGSII